MISANGTFKHGITRGDITILGDNANVEAFYLEKLNAMMQTVATALPAI